MSDFVTAEGLVIKTVETILEELAAAQRADIDDALNTAADSPLGQLNGIFANQLREAWEVLDVAYNGFNPDAAESFLLDALSAITGTVRHAATPSTLKLLSKATINLNAGITLPTGSVAHVLGRPDIRFVTTEDVTNSGGAAADVLVSMESEETGPIVALASTLTVIAEPVVGWNSVTNDFDADPGQVLDTDETLRARREEELRATGSGSTAAVRADLLTIEGVESVTVFENRGDLANADGLPGHSIEALIFDGDVPAVDDDLIAQTIWDSKGTGTGTVGTSSGIAIDDLGNSQTVYFTRPTVKNVWLEFAITRDAVTYPGDTALKAAIVAKGNAVLSPGQDVIALVYQAAALGVTGVTDVPDLDLGFSAAPTSGANLVVGSREMAKLDTSRISVTVV